MMIDFLDRLNRDTERKVMVIVDGNPAHVGRRRRPWRYERASRCALVWLRGHARELTSDALIKQDLTSHVLGSGHAKTQDELVRET